MRHCFPAAQFLVLLAASALLGVLPPAALAQMESPLKGQGVPANDTLEVFLSVYLDRLLAVDDQNYRYEAAFLFYLTWRDASAYYTVRNLTQRMRAGNYACEHHCTDWVGAQSCCDDMWQPTFFFRNAYGFPEDRATGYKLYALPPPNSSVLWTQFVHGVFYQPMDLSHYPFDSWDLLLTLEFLDTSTPDHPGVTVQLSSGSPRLYTYGRGDAVSQWGVEGISMQVMQVDSVEWFKTNSILPSNPRDPLGLTNSDTALLRGCAPGATSIQEARNLTLVIVRVRIHRLWRFHVLNTVLPVAMVGVISFVVFFLDRKELATRLGVVVTLFLALAAVQFVISDSQPASSYVMPTQQLVVTTYVLLALIAVESILVYHVETWREISLAAVKRREARDRYLALRTHSQDPQAAREPAAERQHSPPDKEPTSAARDQHVVHFAEPFDREKASAGDDGQAAAAVSPCGPGDSKSRAAASTHKLTRSESLRIDADYDAYLAYVLDRTALGLLLLGFAVAVILIFVLQSGYINLFG